MQNLLKNYRDSAVQLRETANSSTDSATRESLLKKAFEYEDMADALETLVGNHSANPKRPTR